MSSVLAFEANSVLEWKYFKNEIVLKGLTEKYVFSICSFVKGHLKNLLELSVGRYDKFTKYVSFT